MKKLYLLLIVFSATAQLNCQTILNGDFEDGSGILDFPNWTVNWNTFIAPAPGGYLDTIDPYSGNYYFYLYSTSIPMVGIFAGILTNGEISEWTGPYGGKPFDHRPGSLIGYYKNTPGGNDD